MPVVSAVGTAVSHGATGQDGDRLKRIQLAMSDAVTQAHIEGVTDQDIIRARILAARDKAVNG